VPGNKETTLATIRAAEGMPIHLTHIQFHSYGTEGDFKFSSGAAEIAELVNQHTNVSIDVGQIMFGQTVTASGDAMRQYGNTKSAEPKKWVIMDIECDAGCGVVPMRYKDKSFVNALQWAIGLEMFLLVNDPWRVFLTTDHPNGAPFTTYPHLIRLLMDRTFRNEQLRRLHPGAQAATTLGTLTREYTLYEIAIMTRAGPARSLGLKDRGHLGPGACADITVYDDNPDREAMFTTPAFVFKNGEMIVRNGKIVHVVTGATHVVRR
jgi:formylmethanofuran dehydrogenase subunit A